MSITKPAAIVFNWDEFSLPFADIAVKRFLQAWGTGRTIFE